MRPLPRRIIDVTSAAEYFLRSSTSDGNSGGVPPRSSRWQRGAVLAYRDDLGAGLLFSHRRAPRSQHPGHLVGVHVEQAALRIERAPPHSPPPSKPGNMTVPWRLGGIELARHCAPCGTAPARPRAPRECAWSACPRSTSGGRKAAASRERLHLRQTPLHPRSTAGPCALRSGNSGLPVSRSKTKTKPDFVICATASIGAAVALTVTRFGGAGKSRSQTSCRTRLKMPHALARIGIQREQRIGEEIVADADSRRRNRTTPIRWARRPDRASHPRLMPDQLLAPPEYFHASLGQVS